jgi:integrase
LRAALTSAVKYGYVLRNVAALAEPPRAEKPRITPLDADQVTRLLAAVDGHRHKALYHTAIQLGMRLAELLDLRWSDVDLAAGTLIIRQGKTESSVRTLPLSASLRQVLTEHWSYQHDERLARGTDWKETGRVFPSEVGTRITPGSLHRHFKRSLAAADLPTTTRWHDLRHTCASLLLQSGVSLKTVSDLLGHSTTAITADIYAHVYHEDKQAAVALWDRLTG